MPLILNGTVDEAVNQLKVLPSPMFFTRSLTGNGKGMGFLKGTLLPARDAASVQTSPLTCRDIKTSTSSGTADYEFIPTMLFDASGYRNLYVPSVPEDAVCVSNDTIPDEDKIYMLVTLHDAVMAVTDKDDPVKKKKNIYCNYDITVFKKNTNNTNNDPDLNYVIDCYTEPALNNRQFVNYANVDPTLLDDYFGSLSIYDIIAQTVVVWQSCIPGIVKMMIKNYQVGNYSINNIDELLRILSIRLNNYSVSLMDYKSIYDIVFQMKPDAIPVITEVNLNLLLNATLKTLEQNKANIKMFTPVPIQSPIVRLSKEQEKAVCTTEPCCIVQAGAGTGKSTVINNRITYLEQCGVNLNNVMVLSFTNAAADHIKDIAPNVNSKTIASMIHDIYAMNWQHNLSTVDTILNIMRASKTINNRGNRVGMKLINGFVMLKKDINTGLIELSNIVSQHFDEVIAILDEINQTTLEMESIICYHANNLKEPNGLCEHLIMDEVQDNSIFEFIYVINYVVRHNASIYLVGDCSQTLYEFRASNPKALNCLEMSGVFECMQLQTNYRSNQNILDFANLTLNTIEANQFARIQLHANSYQRRAFDEDVTVKYTQLLGKRSLEDRFPSMLSEAKEWIQDKLDKGEQVAFLSYRRRDLTMFEKIIEIIFPDKTLVNITPIKSYANSFFSKYIYYLGEDYTHKIGGNGCVEVMRHIIDNIDRLCTHEQQKETLKAFIAEWRQTYEQQFILLDAQVKLGAITNEEYKSQLFQTLVDFEIDKNAMKQHLVSMENEKMKSQDVSEFNFVTSTIHSAKGLEFQNVILLYDESRKDSEEDKRMYYVGLTRAKSAEFIIAYNTQKTSIIQESYNVMCAAQAAKAAKNAGTSGTGTDNSDETDEPVTIEPANNQVTA